MTPSVPNQPRVLGSWKEIAAYLGKGVRTVQRWENDFGLPVRRPDSCAKGVVCAATEDLDQWLAMHWAQRHSAALHDLKLENNPTDVVQASRELRRQNQELVLNLLHNLEVMKHRCDDFVKTYNQVRASRLRGLPHTMRSQAAAMAEARVPKAG